MGRHERAVVGASVAIAGSIVALLAGGPMIGACLGPLGVTAVQCAAHGGGVPTTGAIGPQVLGASCAGSLCLLGVPRTRWAVGTALTGAAIGAATYLSVRPRTLEGPDYDGTWLSIPLPVEPFSLGSWAIAAALLALLALRVAIAARTR